MHTSPTLVGLLQQQAERYQDKVAFTFSYNGDDEGRTQLTYRELDLRARAIAANLQQQGAAGERVLIFCRAGLEAIAGFFGCLYAGAVAVPVHQKLAPRLTFVIPDARARFAVASPETPANIQAGAEALVALIEGQPLRWCLTDDGDAAQWVPPAGLTPDSTALIQYTSGSTTSPKGVMLTHRNLLHNLEDIRSVWDGGDQDVAVWWLPQHHDLGLIAAVLEMVYVGCTSVLMSPSAFIQQPTRWLEALSRNRATLTAAPNFAFEQCVEHTTAAQRAALDLSNLAYAWTGTEPVRATTLQGFAEAFAPAGFRLEAFRPAFGLAEATLVVSAGSDSPVPMVRRIDRAALGEDRVVDAAPDAATALTLVGCGRPLGGQRVVIVDPETHRSVGPDEVGEIWVTGPNVAQGYWDKPDETERAFQAILADTGEGPFLRTGDLGFLCRGEVFVTGRWSDLVVIDGANHYPNDIEATVEDCHPVLLSGRGAVFTVTPESGALEQLVVVQEVGGPVGEAELREVVDAIQGVVTAHHGIRVDSVVLVSAMRIPTTSSGKIQRGLCRQQFLDRSLDTVAEWHAPAPPNGAGSPQEARLTRLIEAAVARRAASTPGT